MIGYRVWVTSDDRTILGIEAVMIEVDRVIYHLTKFKMYIKMIGIYK